VLGFSGDHVLKLDVGSLERFLIVCSRPEMYTLHLLERLAQRFPLDFYSLKGVFSEKVSGLVNVVAAEQLLADVLSFEGLSYSVSSRVIAEAFKCSLALSEEEFLLLHSILNSLLKQNSKINLLHVVSGVKSFYGGDSSFFEKSVALKLEWRLHLIEELLPYTIGGGQASQKGNVYYNISTVSSLEAKILTLLLLLSRNLLREDVRLQLILLSPCPERFKANIVKFIRFIQAISSLKPIVLSCDEGFPIECLGFFKTLVFDRSFLERFRGGSKASCERRGFEGELFLVQGDDAVPFFYEEPNVAYSVEGAPALRESHVEDHALFQRILEVIVKYPNVTKQGLVQSLSIDYPTEVVEYVLNEMIEKGYVMVEVEKSKSGSFAKLSISMDGRAMLSKKKADEC